MIVTLKKDTTIENKELLLNELKHRQIEYMFLNNDKTILSLTTDDNFDYSSLYAYNFVLKVQRITSPFKLTSRDYQKEDTIVNVNGVKFGGKENIVIIAGPCAIETKEQINEIASSLKKLSINCLRGGIYKPRTSPYTFQGLGEVGLTYLKDVKKKTGLNIVSEIVSISQIDEFVKNVDIIQVGARNMQNFELLKALGKIDKPIILKRGFSSTIEEFLLAAEYILSQGNKNVILCERGLRNFDTYTRFSLDLSSIPLLKQLTHLPIIVDPSHATGRYDLVEPMALASICAGADGLLIEVHNKPESALSDGGQSLKIERFEKLLNKCKEVAKVIGRDI